MTETNLNNDTNSQISINEQVPSSTNTVPMGQDHKRFVASAFYKFLISLMDWKRSFDLSQLVDHQIQDLVPHFITDPWLIKSHTRYSTLGKNDVRTESYLSQLPTPSWYPNTCEVDDSELGPLSLEVGHIGFVKLGFHSIEGDYHPIGQFARINTAFRTNQALTEVPTWAKIFGRTFDDNVAVEMSLKDLMRFDIRGSLSSVLTSLLLTWTAFNSGYYVDGSWLAGGQRLKQNGWQDTVPQTINNPQPSTFTVFPFIDGTTYYPKPPGAVNYFAEFCTITYYFYNEVWKTHQGPIVFVPTTMGYEAMKFFTMAQISHPYIAPEYAFHRVTAPNGTRTDYATEEDLPDPSAACFWYSWATHSTFWVSQGWLTTSDGSSPNQTILYVFSDQFTQHCSNPYGWDDDGDLASGIHNTIPIPYFDDLFLNDAWFPRWMGGLSEAIAYCHTVFSKDDVDMAYNLAAEFSTRFSTPAARSIFNVNSTHVNWNHALHGYEDLTWAPDQIRQFDEVEFETWRNCFLTPSGLRCRVTNITDRETRTLPQAGTIPRLDPELIGAIIAKWMAPSSFNQRLPFDYHCIQSYLENNRYRLALCFDFATQLLSGMDWITWTFAPTRLTWIRSLLGFESRLWSDSRGQTYLKILESKQEFTYEAILSRIFHQTGAPYNTTQIAAWPMSRVDPWRSRVVHETLHLESRSLSFYLNNQGNEVRLTPETFTDRQFPPYKKWALKNDPKLWNDKEFFLMFVCSIDYNTAVVGSKEIDHGVLHTFPATTWKNGLYVEAVSYCNYDYRLNTQWNNSYLSEKNLFSTYPWPHFKPYIQPTVRYRQAMNWCVFENEMFKNPRNPEFYLLPKFPFRTVSMQETNNDQFDDVIDNDGIPF